MDEADQEAAEPRKLARIIACLKPHREWDEAFAAFIDDFETNANRMRCDLYRKRDLPAGSCIVESVRRQIVGSRFKRAGCRWSKAGANTLLASKMQLREQSLGRLPGLKDRRVAVA